MMSWDIAFKTKQIFIVFSSDCSIFSFKRHSECYQRSSESEGAKNVYTFCFQLKFHNSKRFYLLHIYSSTQNDR